MIDPHSGPFPCLLIYGLLDFQVVKLEGSCLETPKQLYLFFFHIKIYIIVFFLCVCVVMGVRLGRSRPNHGDLRGQMQVPRLGSECFYPLSHLSCPCINFFKPAWPVSNGVLGRHLLHETSKEEGILLMQLGRSQPSWTQSHLVPHSCPVTWAPLSHMPAFFLISPFSLSIFLKKKKTH